MFVTQQARASHARLQQLLASLVLALVLVLLGAAPVDAAASPTASSSTYGGYGRQLQPADASSLSHAWMGKLGDDTRIFLDLSIPGTHNSATYKFSDGSISQCQAATVGRQLDAGVRFLDLRLACLWGTVHVVHGYLSTAANTPTFEDVMGQVKDFLDRNPSEVIVARARKEDVGWWNPWDEALVASAFNAYIPAGTYRDTACTRYTCTLGPSRGKIIFLQQRLSVSSLSLLSYTEVLQKRQDSFAFDRISYLYTKWLVVLSYLTAAANPANEGASYIHYLSGSQNTSDVDITNVVYPFHVASGQSSHEEARPLQLTGLVENVTDMEHCSWGDAAEQRDFPRVNCDGCGNRTECRVAYQGTNRLFLAWLRAGLRGEPQTHEYPYVFPKRLGIVAMDFPDNAVVDAVVAANYATAPPHSSAAAPRTSVLRTSGAHRNGARLSFSCVRRVCPTGVAGDAMVHTVNRGAVLASAVVAGDVVRPGPSPNNGTRDRDDEGGCVVLSSVVSDSTGSIMVLDSVPPAALVALASYEADSGMGSDSPRSVSSSVSSPITSASTALLASPSSSSLGEEEEEPPLSHHSESSGEGSSSSTSALPLGIAPMVAAEWDAPLRQHALRRGIVNVSELYVYGAVASANAARWHPSSLVHYTSTCPLVDLFPLSRGDGPPYAVLLSPVPSFLCEAASPPSTSDRAVMSVEQHARVHAVMMRVVNRTGVFWLDPAAYVEANPPQVSGGMSDAVAAAIAEAAAELQPMRSTAAAAALPAVCAALLSCLEANRTDATSCGAFEREAAAWVRAHVSWPLYGSLVDRAYPHLGDPSAASGNLLQDVLTH